MEFPDTYQHSVHSREERRDDGYTRAEVEQAVQEGAVFEPTKTPGVGKRLYCCTGPTSLSALCITSCTCCSGSQGTRDGSHNGLRSQQEVLEVERGLYRADRS